MSEQFEVGQRVLVPATVVPAEPDDELLGGYPFVQVKLDSGDRLPQLVTRPRVGTTERLDALEEFWAAYKKNIGPWDPMPGAKRFMRPAYDALVALEVPARLKRSVALEALAREVRAVILPHPGTLLRKALDDLDKSEPD